MDIKLLDQNHLLNWLKQFNDTDKNLATSLVKDINFIDQLDYDIYTSNLVNKIYDLSKGFSNVYLIPINSLDEETNEPKSDTSLVFNIKKKLPATMTPIWELNNSLLARNSIIFFIDEFIGTGNTFKDNILSIDQKILKRIRSLSSYKKIQVFILSIVIYPQAIRLLKSNFKFINNFIFEIKGTSFNMKKYSKFFHTYVIKKNCEKAMLGFNKEQSPLKGICSNIVFYNNCPNNTPSILWCKQKKDDTPLFEKKRVHLKYKLSYYNEKQKYQRILKFIHKSSNNANILKKLIETETYSFAIDCLLFLIQRKNYSAEKFKFYSNTSTNKLQKIVETCYTHGILSTKRQNGKLTKKGKVLIDQIVNIYDAFYNKKDHKELYIENKDVLLYYPLQIKGNKLDVQ